MWTNLSFLFVALLGHKQGEDKAKACPGGESNRNWDPIEIQAQVSMTWKTAEMCSMVRGAQDQREGKSGPEN